MTTATIKAKLAAIVAAEGVTEGPWTSSYETIYTREHRVGLADESKRDGPHQVAWTALGGYTDARWIARCRTITPGMAEVHLEEIEWLEESAWENSVCEDRLAALVERLEGILGS
jgi:hypothetical protein